MMLFSAKKSLTGSPFGLQASNSVRKSCKYDSHSGVFFWPAGRGPTLFDNNLLRSVKSCLDVGELQKGIIVALGPIRAPFRFSSLIGVSWAISSAARNC